MTTCDSSGIDFLMRHFERLPQESAAMYAGYFCGLFEYGLITDVSVHPDDRNARGGPTFYLRTQRVGWCNINTIASAQQKRRARAAFWSGGTPFPGLKLCCFNIVDSCGWVDLTSDAEVARALEYASMSAHLADPSIEQLKSPAPPTDDHANLLADLRRRLRGHIR